MKVLRTLILAVSLSAFIPAFAQNAPKKSGLFSVDEEYYTATIKVTGAPVAKKYAAVFAKHGLDATNTGDWMDVLDKIAVMKETDLAMNLEVTMSTTDDGVEAAGTSLEHLEQMLGAMNAVLATPQKLDAFLTEQERLLEKSKE